MTEKALKEIMDKDLKEIFNVKNIIDFQFDLMQKSYTKGLETGMLVSKPQWHDLRKNPDDLPDDIYDVLNQTGCRVHYNFFQDVWVNEKDMIDENVIAWCEIPEFEE